MLTRVRRLRLPFEWALDGSSVFYGRAIAVVVRYPAHCHLQAQALLDELTSAAESWMAQSDHGLQLAALTSALHAHLQASLGGREATVKPLSVTCRLGDLEFIEETAP